MFDRISIILLAVGATIISLTYALNILPQFLPYLGLVSIFGGIIKYLRDKEKVKKVRYDLIEKFFEPPISLLRTMMKNKGISSQKIDDIIKKAESNITNKDEIIPNILLVSYEFTSILKIEESFQKSYALALAYVSVFEKNIDKGNFANDIDHEITDVEKIKCGEEYWKLNPEIVNWYILFSESEDLLIESFQRIYDKVKDSTEKSDEIQIERKQEHSELSGLNGYLLKKEDRFQKLLAFINKKIPRYDFLRIMVSLRTDVVIISLQGASDPADRGTSDQTHTGAEFVNDALEELPPKFGKLNRSVYFAFLKDVVPEGEDPKYFDFQLWGKNIERRAQEFRDDVGRDQRKFNFVVIKTSLHEFASFGDALGDKSRIKISSDMFDVLNSQDVHLSTLSSMAKIIREVESTSLHEFIDKNLDYLDVFSNNIELAKSISEKCMKKHEVTEWKISDFKRKGVTSDELLELGLSENQAKDLLEESKEIHEILFP